jgi:hypothetical protein
MLAAFGWSGLIDPLALTLLKKRELKAAGEIFQMGHTCCSVCAS